MNLAYSEHARKYLHECGLPKERVYVTGSPMAEVLHANLPAIEASDIQQRLGLTKGKYILLSAHREENIDTEKNFRSLFTAVNAMAEKYDMPILYSCHPRSRKRLEERRLPAGPRVIQHEPLGFHDYNCLQMNAFAVVSDSGTLPEESSFFTSVGHPFPAVCIRTSTERPEALDKACFVLAGIDENHLLQGGGYRGADESGRGLRHPGPGLCGGKCLHQSGKDHSVLHRRGRQNGLEKILIFQEAGA